MASLLIKIGQMLKGGERMKEQIRLIDCYKKIEDPPIRTKEVERMEKGKEIVANHPIDITAINGIPKEYSKNCRVRIYKPAQNLMQSGTDNIKHWEVEFDNKERWENPCIGWTSSGDSHSNLKIYFTTKEEAIAFCNKNLWRWYVDETPLKKSMKPKDYSEIYAWNKRTRASTK